MHGEEDSTLFYQDLIALGLVLGNPHANQRARYPAYCAACAYPRKRRHDRTGGVEGTQTRYGQSANAHQPSHNAPPSTAPVPPPIAAPSGALVPLSWAKRLEPAFSGNRTEISVFRNPASFKTSTAFSTL